MSKVERSRMSGKPTNKTTTAMTRSGGSAERERTQVAIQMLVNKGWDEAVNAKQTTTLEESGNVVQDKDLLIGVPMLIVETRFTISKQYGTPFVSVTAMLKTGEVIIFNDGSTGICKQLDGIEVSPEKPLHVPGGLRRSDYDVEGPNKTMIKASTYYLSGSRSSAEIKGLNRNTAPANGRALRA